MKIYDLKTPAFLLDLDKLEANLKNYQSICDEHNVKLIPMTKTHKCSEIARMQLNMGADGFLVGTLDEAVKLSKIGNLDITLAYPFIDQTSLEIINDLTENIKITLSIDSLEVAGIYNNYFNEKNKDIDYLLIINSGLNRFGVSSKKAGIIVKTIMKQFSNLNFLGICTHPGQVYKEDNYEGVCKVAKMSREAMQEAINSLNEYSLKAEIVATGSTPTFLSDISNNIYNVLRPGNYVYFDAIQIALGIIKENKCALTVLATVIGNPCENTYIIDCGSKCLGLDKGAHSSKNITGFGRIVGKEELFIESLSEEVAIVKAISDTNIKIGDKLQIIPNHSCSTNNMTSYLIGTRGNETKRIIDIDIRGNSIKPKI